MRRYASLWLPGLVLLAAGCGSKGTITGTISYKGKPIPQGYVLFQPAEGPSINAIINDGKYTAEKVPVGPTKVAVSSFHDGGGQGQMTAKMLYGGGKGGGPSPDANMPEEARKMIAGAGAAAKKGFPIPEKYNKIEESGLIYTVTSGSQTKDFNLD